ncbi:sensor histidine kinase [Actinoplanes regularis]|uniref:sensor histidine kinase n=1 Tax=Actinoplanes regularis TaxID=52697 RepID=UPI0024A0A7AB|nr:HAMP domain-containing sensor histidine kinase [Actinoplanes regularis]GLW35910.1 hypothetical protein Areg01_88450 [Actinoplanes regularis]
MDTGANGDPSQHRDTPGEHTTPFDLLRAAVDSSTGERDLYSVARHEFSNLISGITGLAGILLRTVEQPAPAEVRGRQLKLILNNADSLQGALDNLLLAGHLRSGATTVRYEEVDLSDLVRQTVDRSRAAADDRSLTLTVISGPQARVVTDASLAGALIARILDNAITFTDSGAVTVTVPDTAPGAPRRVEIHDTGRGVTSGERDDLTRPFFRGQAAAGSTGCGLGLHAASVIAEVLGCGIELAAEEPTRSGGTTFIVTFPVGDRRGDQERP